MLRTKFILYFLILCFSSLNAQVIIKVIPGYVLIDTDTGIGDLNEKIEVYRLKGDGVIPVGQVRIIRFRQGQTAAKIVSMESGFAIIVGDFVSEKKLDDAAISQIPMEQKNVNGGLHGGRFLPSSNLENSLENSYSLGVFLKLITLENHSFFVEVSYPLLKNKYAGTNDIESTMILVHISDHIRLGNRIHWDVGGGLYYSQMSVNMNGQSIDKSESYTGFFVGLSVDFTNASRFIFSPALRYHAYKTEINWNEFIISGVNVYFSLF